MNKYYVECFSIKQQAITTYTYNIQNIKKDWTCILKILLVLEEFALGIYSYTEGLVADTVILQNVKGIMFSQKSVAIVDFSTILVTCISHFPLCLFFFFNKPFFPSFSWKAHLCFTNSTCLQLIAQVDRCKHSLLVFLHMKNSGDNLVFTEGKGLILLRIATTGQNFA